MSETFDVTVRHRLGCWLYERRRAEIVLFMPWLARRVGWSWMDLCNRAETLTRDKRCTGRGCPWADSSRLTLASVFPRVGGRLLAHCLKEWPIEFAESSAPRQAVVSPEVSLIFTVRGTSRLKQFQTALASARMQADVACEIIVVEQSAIQKYGELLPADVRYFHTPIPNETIPFNRSWALNYGVRQARGHVVALLDSDMLVPASFAAAAVQVLQRGAAAVRPARLIFYLDEATSREVQWQRSLNGIQQVSIVTQNTPNPIVMRRCDYLAIGGHDEEFFGWGGEDCEFVSRMRTLDTCEAGFLPVVHLWHPMASRDLATLNHDRVRQRVDVPLGERIARLSQLPFGGDVPTAPWPNPPDSCNTAVDPTVSMMGSVAGAF